MTSIYVAIELNIGQSSHLYAIPIDFYTLYASVPTDLANWGPSGPDQTTKIFRTGPNGPGPDLPEKECYETLQKTWIKKLILLERKKF